MGPAGSQLQRRAAVLVPVFRDEQETLRLLLVIREDRGIHGRQLGFPGGYQELSDDTLLHTALRETEEEVGLAREHVDVLAALPDVHATVSETLVSPFLGRIPVPHELQPQTTELTGLLTPAIDRLCDPAVRDRLPFTSAAIPDGMIVDGIDVEGHVLWGLSLRILDDLLPRLVGGEWPV